MIDQSDAKHTNILHKIVNNTNSSEEYPVITKALFHISYVKKLLVSFIALLISHL